MEKKMWVGWVVVVCLSATAHSNDGIIGFGNGQSMNPGDVIHAVDDGKTSRFIQKSVTPVSMGWNSTEGGALKNWEMLETAFQSLENGAAPSARSLCGTWKGVVGVTNDLSLHLHPSPFEGAAHAPMMRIHSDMGFWFNMEPWYAYLEYVSLGETMLTIGEGGVFSKSKPGTFQLYKSGGVDEILSEDIKGEFEIGPHSVSTKVGFADRVFDPGWLRRNFGASEYVTERFHWLECRLIDQDHLVCKLRSGGGIREGGSGQMPIKDAMMIGFERDSESKCASY